jgi:hypothetical protein
MDEKIKYILKFGIFVLLILALMNILGINLNDTSKSQTNSLFEGLQPGTLGMEPGTLGIQPGTLNLATGANAFCDLYRGSSNSLNIACGRLTNKNCNETACCVFTNNKCVAGGVNGPTYNSDSNGNTSTADYYFQNQCYGAGCP